VIANVAVFLTALGRLEEGVQFAAYASAHDPANALTYNNLGIRYRYVGDYANAEKAFADCLRLSPEFGGANYELGATRLLTGEYEAAVASFQAEPLVVFSQIGMAMSHYAQGDSGQSEQLLNELIADYGDDIAYYVAQTLAFRREADHAFDWLEKTRRLGDRELLNVINEPLFDNLEADPRWLPFLESIGQSPTQLADIEFTPTLPQDRTAAGSHAMVRD
jgi:tetratricopeptide (TPR) repeat protein